MSEQEQREITSDSPTGGTTIVFGGAVPTGPTGPTGMTDLTDPSVRTFAGEGGPIIIYERNRGDGGDAIVDGDDNGSSPWHSESTIDFGKSETGENSVRHVMTVVEPGEMIPMPWRSVDVDGASTVVGGDGETRIVTHADGSTTIHAMDVAQEASEKVIQTRIKRVVQAHEITSKCRKIVDRIARVAEFVGIRAIVPKMFDAMPDKIDGMRSSAWYYDAADYCHAVIEVHENLATTIMCKTATGDLVIECSPQKDPLRAEWLPLLFVIRTGNLE